MINVKIKIHYIVIIKINVNTNNMKTDKEIKTLKFIKRFEGKIRYINRETGLIGALFEQSENA